MKSVKKILALFMASIALLSLLSGASYAEEYQPSNTRGNGDINDDGWIDVYDARLALRFACRLDDPLDDEQARNADIDCDGIISVADARIILRISQGLDSSTAPVRKMKDIPGIIHTEPVIDLEKTDKNYSGFYITSEEANDGKIVYSVRLKNCVGLTAYELNIAVDDKNFVFYDYDLSGDWEKSHRLVYSINSVAWGTNTATFTGVLADSLESTDKYLDNSYSPIGFRAEDFEICRITLEERQAFSTRNAHFAINGVIITDDGLRDSILDVVIEHPNGYVGPENPSKNCTHICHSDDNILSMIWKFVCLIYRLFGVEQYCFCGAKHW